MRIRLLFSKSLWIVLTALALGAFAAPASAACMQGKLANTEQIAAKDRGAPFDVLVAKRYIPVFRAHGFTLVECSAELSTTEGRAKARDDLCASAYFGNEAVQAQLRRIFGVHPALICRNAELIAGDWSGKKIDFDEGDLTIDAETDG